MVKKIAVMIIILLWSSSVMAVDIRKLDLKFNVGGYLGLHIFDKDQDLYSGKNLSEQDYGDYPGNMAIVGGVFGVDYKSFTVETGIGFVPSTLNKSEDFAPIVIITLSGLYRFTKLLPSKFRTTPFIKFDVGNMGIFADSENVQNDGDFLLGSAIGAIYQMTKTLSLRVDMGYIATDAVKNKVANNFQVKAMVSWSFELDKDTDGDGIYDSVDKCINKKEDADSFEDTDGCPELDNDKDGVVDKLDKCPGVDKDALNGFKDVAEDKDGFQDEDGCPDLDNDGDKIPDSIDKCKGTDEDVASKFIKSREDFDKFQDEDGCPELDNDKDGVNDKVDKCPGTESDIKNKFINVAEDLDGFQDKDGCPDTDNDKDGIIDTLDKCPGKDADVSDNFATTKEDKDGFDDGDGCPDWDNDRDGIPDSQDKCVGTEGDKSDDFIKTKEVINGYKDDDGCPDKKGKVRVIVLKDKIKILDKIYFKYGKSILKKRSFPLLRQIALNLKAYSQIKKLEVQGHTGSIGSSSKNMNLSTARARAVVEFLIKEGIKPSRLEAKGLGEEIPLVHCKKKRSRRRRKRCEKKNRRVEFIIISQN
jgi:OmpA-OmpF porin, OOP family